MSGSVLGNGNSMVNKMENSSFFYFIGDGGERKINKKISSGEK